MLSSYAGRGSLPHRPDLLLKMVLYEHQIGRPQPTQWLADLKENKAVEWLTFGIKVPRSVLYEFRDRVQPFLAGLNQQVIRTAIDEKHTDASKASLDGTFVAANASRHRLLSLKTVEQRLEQLDQEIAKNEAAEASRATTPSAVVTRADEAVETGVVEAIPAQPETEPNQQPSTTQDLIGTADGDQGSTAVVHGQDKAWHEAAACRNIAKLRKFSRSGTRPTRSGAKTNARNRNRFDVAIGDPMAPFGRDKMKVFRPLYNVQTMTDLKTDFVFTYSVTPTLSDSGHLVPMIIQMNEVTKQLLRMLLADSGYPSGDDLAQCEALNV